ncbi:MAG: prepilin-type N-terminal cleavage/methylation domain-containing protein [Candidatus Hydrogenedentes bacterium]|nr:prepilin-type N-terminal cleavage/methylation domain-containing protein [Candidatus Hydrogenedentota bacterium]
MQRTSPTEQRSSSAGFTLMELIIVLTIIAVMSATVVPVYHGSVSFIQRDRATRDFIALMKYAQERAIIDTVEYRFYMSPDKGAYWIMRYDKTDERGERLFARPDGGEGIVRHLPKTITLKKPKAHLDRKAKAQYISFFPGGACDEAKLELTLDRRQKVTIDTKGRLGQFEVKS